MMYAPRRILKAAGWLLFGTPSQRRRVRQEMARLSAGLFGDYYLSDDYKLWLEDREFLEKYRQLSPDNPYSKDRKYVLREFARMVGKVPGSAAECGCYEGATAWFIANELPDVPLYLFDSFSGLSAPVGDDSPVSEDHFAWRAGDLKANAEKVRATLAAFDNVTLYEGWIPERFHEVEGESFRLVHIDVDLYEPTRDSIAFFYPRMARGGVMIFDDYGLTSCPGAYKAIREYMGDKEEYLLHLPTGQGVVIKA